MATVAENIATTIAGYAEALAADSVNPRTSYSLDGKSVSRNEWRDGLARLIVELNKFANAQSPYVVSTKMVL